MEANRKDADTLYLGLIRQAVWGSMTMEAGVTIMTITTVVFVITQKMLLTASIGGGLYLLGIALSLGDPFYLRILTLRYFKLKPSRTHLFWRSGRRYMP